MAIYRKAAVLAAALFSLCLMLLPPDAVAQPTYSCRAFQFEPNGQARPIVPSPEPDTAGWDAPGYCRFVGTAIDYERIHDVAITREQGAIRVRINVQIMMPDSCIGWPFYTCRYGHCHEWVDAWIDWNGNHVWEPQEHVLDQATTVSGAGIIPFEVTVPIPPNAAAETYLRAVLRYGVDDNDPCYDYNDYGDQQDALVSVGNVAVDSITVTGSKTVLSDVQDPVWTATFGPAPDYEVQPGTAKTVAGGFATTGPKLHLHLSGRPAAPSYSPTVQYRWQIPATGTATRSGSGTFPGMAGDVQLELPDQVTQTDGKLVVDVLNPEGDYVQRGQTVVLPLLVGIEPSKVARIREAVLQKAVQFASGKKTPEEAAVSIMGRIYNSGWHYYDWGSPGWGDWEPLLLGAATAGNCVSVSRMWKNLSGALGLSTYTWATSNEGIYHILTVTGSRSFDGRFGNAAHWPSLIRDRWEFIMHQVGVLSADAGSQPLFDPTYNRRYALLRDCVAVRWPGIPLDWDYLRSFDNMTAFRMIQDPDTTHWLEGDWGASWYKDATPGPEDRARAGRSATITDPPSFEGPFVWTPIDANGDGQYEVLRLAGLVSTGTWQNVSWSGVLTTTAGELVSCRPGGLAAGAAGGALFAAVPGSYPFEVDFSGEEIRTKATAGPYRCRLQLFAGGEVAATDTVVSPGYSSSTFGESPVEIIGLTVTPVDGNGNGLYDTLAVDVTTLCHAAAEGALVVSVVNPADTSLVASSSLPVVFEAGTASVRVGLDGRDIRRAGASGALPMVARLEVSGSPAVEKSGLTPSINPTAFEPAPVSVAGQVADSLVGPIGGPYSALLVSVPVSVGSAGSYTAAAVLRGWQWLSPTGSLGRPKGVASPGGGESVGHLVDAAEATQTVTLASGAQAIQLRFSGPDISGSEVDGPYTVASFRVTGPDGYLSIAVDSLFLTRPCLSSNFTPPTPTDPLVTIHGVSFAAPVDTSGNGLFDELPVAVDVTSAVAGQVTVSGSLFSPSGAFIQAASTTDTLANGERRVISLMYSGRMLYAQNEYGPCSVHSIHAFNAVAPLRDAAYPNTVQATWVSPNLFEPAPAVVGSVRLANGQGIAGAAVVAQPAGSACYTGTAGYYAMNIPGSGGSQQTVTLQPTEVSGYPADKWQAYVNGSYIGQTRTVQVTPALGERVTVWFVNGEAYAGVDGGTLPDNGFHLSVRPNPVSPGQAVIVMARWPSTRVARIRVFDVQGRLVQELPTRRSGTEATVRWDGLDGSGKRVRSGLYLVQLSMGPGQSLVKRVVVLQ